MSPVPNTCSGCVNWHREPATAENLAPSAGECRWGPPQQTILPTAQAGSVIRLCDYPHVEGRTAACSQYKPRAVGIIT